MRKVWATAGFAALLSLGIAAGWASVNVGFGLAGNKPVAAELANAARQLPRLWVIILPIAAFLAGRRASLRALGSSAIGSTVAAAALLAIAALVTLETVGPIIASNDAEHDRAPVDLRTPVETIPGIELYHLHVSRDVLRSGVHGLFSEQRILASRLDWEWGFRLAVPWLVFLALPIGFRVAGPGHLSPSDSAWGASLGFLLLAFLMIATIGGQELSEQYGVQAVIPLVILIFVPMTVLLALSRPCSSWPHQVE